MAEGRFLDTRENHLIYATQEGTAGGKEDQDAMGSLQPGPDVDYLGLPVHFHSASSSSLQKGRPKGRKAEKPVKLSQRRGQNGDEEDREDVNQSAAGTSVGSPQADDSEDNNSVIKKIKWDISRDFTKEQRKQNMPGGIGIKEADQTQPISCDLCDKVFQEASDYLSHMHSHSQHSPSADISEGNSLHNGLADTGGKDGEDLELDKVEGLKVQGMVGDKPILHCEDCEAVFTDLYQFNLHREEAHPEQDAMKRYECQSCGKTFLGRRVLNQHYRRSHPEEKFYTCPICSQTFPTASSLSLHKRNHVGHRPFKCDYDGCDRAFPDVASLNRHGRTHSDERPFACKHCGKAFKMQNHLREHTRLHTGEKPFVCEVCGAGFAQSNGLKSHARQHLLDRGNRCSICHKVFSHPQFLELHKKSHSDEKPFTCELCGQTFRTNTNLGAHKRLKHDLVSRKGKNFFTCDVCNSTFSKACNLAVHKKVHGGEKPFSCDLCDQTFRTPANLGAHRKLKHEMDNHRGEKLFTCDICGASFSQACNLGIHKKKKHVDTPPSQQRNYVCDVCDARFSEPCNLGAHKKIKHSEESDDGRTVFDCDICGAKFYRACNLSGHKRRKHGDSGDMREADKPYPCPFCRLRCTTLENLQEHKTKIHFSMPACFTETKTSYDNAKPQQQTQTPPSDAPTFDNQRQLSHQSNLDVQQSEFPHTFQKVDLPTVFPNAVPLSSEPDKLPHQNSFMSHTPSPSVSGETIHANSNTHTFVNPACENQHQKANFDHGIGAFESRLPVTAAASGMHNFPLNMRSTACNICGAVIPDERSMLQHLEMHSNERYLQDVFSAQ